MQINKKNVMIQMSLCMSRRHTGEIEV